MSCIQLYEFAFTGDAAASSDFQSVIKHLKDAVGQQSVSWAHQAEDSKRVGIVANFDSLKSHEKWTSTSDYKNTTELLSRIASDYASEVVVMPSNAEDSLKANSVELVTWVYPAEKVDSTFEKTAIDGFNKFGASISASKWASGGMVAGWNTKTHETEGKPVKYFTGLIGWQSVDAHYDCKKTPTFQDYIHHMQLGDVRVDMCHYNWAEHRV